MKIELNLTKREAEAIMRCNGFDNGYGIMKSHALKSAEFKLRTAMTGAQAKSDIDAPSQPVTCEHKRTALVTVEAGVIVLNCLDCGFDFSEPIVTAPTSVQCPKCRVYRHPGTACSTASCKPSLGPVVQQEDSE